MAKNVYNVNALQMIFTIKRIENNFLREKCTTNDENARPMIFTNKCVANDFYHENSLPMICYMKMHGQQFLRKKCIANGFYYENALPMIFTIEIHCQCFYYRNTLQHFCNKMHCHWFLLHMILMSRIYPLAKKKKKKKEKKKEKKIIQSYRDTENFVLVKKKWKNYFVFLSTDCIWTWYNVEKNFS